jgi:hypothetical protein
MKFFSDKITTIQANILQLLVAEKLPLDVTHDIDTSGTVIMDCVRHVTKKELTSLIKSSNSKTCSLDPCPTELLKSKFDSHIDVLLNIFNKIFDEGNFPDIFKTAQVTPLLKSSSMDRHILKNYRPISNLPTIGKLLERIGIQRLNEHLEQANKIEIYQSAYKAGHSTETTLLKVFNDIAWEVDKGRIVLLGMIDLSAAFDTISHEKLFQLLEHEYKITGTALQWYKSYFQDRKQFCKLRHHKSNNYDLPTGCPQGSVVGPVAYNLYTAPLERVLQKHGVKYHKYADDLQVYLSCDKKNLDNCITQLEMCLSEVRNWMLRWGLKINESKTEYIMFRNRNIKIPQPSTICIGSTDITASPSVKNLRVIFDSSLNRSSHVSSIMKPVIFISVNLVGSAGIYQQMPASEQYMHWS